jgi:hypothetical protein
MSENNKDVRISTYVDIDMAIEIKQICKLEQKSVADWLRQVLVEELTRRTNQ